MKKSIWTEQSFQILKIFKTCWKITLHLKCVLNFMSFQKNIFGEIGSERKSFGLLPNQLSKTILCGPDGYFQE